MATTHVFIVDINTFRYHLEYMFAGTGARDEIIDFNNVPTSNLHYGKENNLVGMIADFQRVRIGDYVIFYLQQNLASRVYEGKFFGIFRVRDEYSFLDNNDQTQYLRTELVKSLTFRIILEPFEVYSKGVTEWEALDDIRNLVSPNQMLWSLIYRKLKGNRGNTMITIYESERLMNLIRSKNSRTQIEGAGYTFNSENQEIETMAHNRMYVGRNEEINILPRLISKYNQNKAYEFHLQAYIMDAIGRGVNATLDQILLNGNEIEWLGNEVSCGVGMQRIDVMISVNQNPASRFVIPIELKAVEVFPGITKQVQRYVDWLSLYYLPNRPSQIQPVILCEQTENLFATANEEFSTFNTRNSELCRPIKLVEFHVDDENLVFHETEYN